MANAEPSLNSMLNTSDIMVSTCKNKGMLPRKAHCAKKVALSSFRVAPERRADAAANAASALVVAAIFMSSISCCDLTMRILRRA